MKWIKLVTNMFNNRKIKQIRKLPEGDAIIVIWVQILCLAGQTNNNGMVYFSQDIPYTEEMLSIEFDRPINLIRLALKTFENFGMIEIVDDVLLVSNWEKYQSADKLERIREQNRIRQQRFKEKQKLIESNVIGTLQITQDNAIDIDIDIDIDKDLNIYSPVIEYLNEKCNTKYKTNTKKTKDVIKARVNEGFVLEDFKKVIDIKADEWLGTDFEKYLRPETLFSNKFEGYLNQKPVVMKNKQKPANKFHNFTKSDEFSGDDLERMARERFEKKAKELRGKKDEC